MHNYYLCIMDSKKVRIELTELFMAQADKYRCFYGTIRRELDSDGRPLVRGKIKVNDGFILSQAGNQDELGRKLDEMVLLVLDYDIHNSQAKTINICDMDFYLN